MSFISPLPTICLPIQIVINSVDPLYENRYLCTLNVVRDQTYMGGSAVFTCLDIIPNLWVSNFGTGQAWKILEATNYNINTGSVDVLIEDVEFFNYSIEPYYGQHPPSDYVEGYVFAISSEGLPILYNIDTSIYPQEYITSLISRFSMRNYSTTISINQPGHTFQVGKFIMNSL